MPKNDLIPEKYDALSNAVIDACETLNLTQEQVAEGLANILISLVAITGNSTLKVENMNGVVNVLYTENL